MVRRQCGRNRAGAGLVRRAERDHPRGHLGAARSRSENDRRGDQQPSRSVIDLDQEISPIYHAAKAFVEKAFSKEGSMATAMYGPASQATT